MVHVGSVEELGHRGIHIACGRCGRSGERENVVVGASTAWAVVGEVSVASGGVGLSNGVVTTCNSVGVRGG